VPAAIVVKKERNINKTRNLHASPLLRQLKYIANDFWRNLESKKQIKDRKLNLKPFPHRQIGLPQFEIIKMSSVAIIEHKERLTKSGIPPVPAISPRSFSVVVSTSKRVLLGDLVHMPLKEMSWVLTNVSLAPPGELISLDD
jgi:hypothetical protein